MDSLKELFQQMYELTNPLCGKCPVPYSCCDTKYCDIATKYAKDVYNIDLTIFDTGNKVKYLDKEKGCLIPPHLRPMCTLHVCDVNAFGYIRKEPELTDKYYALRNEICKEHNLDMQSHLEFLEQCYKDGKLNDDQLEIAKMFCQPPVGYIEGPGIRLTWMSATKMMMVMIGNEGTVQFVIRNRRKP